MLPLNRPASTVDTVTESKPPVLKIRPTEDFKALPLPRPGGSSFDVQIFEEISTRRRWVGKCDVQAASRPAARTPYKARYYDEYREWLGFTLYQLCGITTPAVVLSAQSCVFNSTPEQKAEMARDYDYETPCLHILSCFLEGFETCGEKYHLYQVSKLEALVPEKIKEHAVVLAGGQAYFVENQRLILRDEKPLSVPISLSAAERALLGGEFGEVKYSNASAHVYDRVVSETTRGKRIRASFLDEYHAHVAQHRDAVFRLTPAGSNVAIPLKGFGAALAVADFIYDGDCVGRGGKNIGYVLSPDKTYAQIVKIDAGFAFSFLEGEVFDHQPKARTVPLAPPGPVGNRVSFLHYDALTKPDKEEFVQMAKRILALPWSTVEAVVEQVIKPEGLSRTQAQLLLEKLWDRRVAFLNEFHPEVSGCLDAEGMELRKQMQREREQMLLKWIGESESKAEATPTTTTDSFSIGQLIGEQQTVESLKSALEALRTTDEKDEKRERKSSESCRLFQCPAVVSDFTGREEIIQQLADALHRNQGGVISQGIRGLGGVGKTQLAAYYVSLAKQGLRCGTQQLRYDAIIWLAAERELESQVRSLAEAWYGIKGLPITDTLVTLDHQLRTQRVLWIFNNAEAEASLLSILKALRGGNYHILITSRNSAWDGIPLLRLEGFSTAEGAAYVKQHLPKASNTEIEALLNTVSHLPLALAHAVAYIKAGYCRLVEYPQEFAKHQLSVEGTVTVSASGQTVMTTFLLTLKKLLPNYPASRAILEACAYFAPENIPITLLEAGLVQHFIFFPTEGYYSNSVFKRSLSALKRHHLLEATTSGTVSIHRLVQGAVRSYHQQRIKTNGIKAHLNHWAVCLSKLLECDESDWSTVVQATPSIPHAWALTEACVKPFTISLEALSTLLDRIGVHQLATSAFRAAEQAFRRKLVLDKRNGKDHLEIAVTLRLLASTLHLLGKTVEAKPLLEQAITLHTKHHRTEHPEFMGTLECLSIVLYDLDQLDEAKFLLEQVLPIRKKYYGQNHPAFAITLGNLGHVLLGLGQTAEAKLLLEQARDIQRRHYGGNHPSFAVALINFARALIDLGQMVEAKLLLEQARVIYEGHYGEHRPEFIQVLSNLGCVLRELGQAAEAKLLFEQVLTICKKYYGAEHSQVALTLANLGETLHILEQTSKAQDYLQEALFISQKYYRNIGPQMAAILWRLGATLRDLGKISRAQDCFRQVYDIFLTQFGAEHHYTKCAEQELARIVRQQLESKSIDSVEVKLDTLQRAVPALPIKSIAQEDKKPEILLGQAVCIFVYQVDQYLKRQEPEKPWDQNASASFVANMVVGLTKGEAEYKARLTEPELYSLPKEIAVFMEGYIYEHPILRTLAQYPEFARNLKNELNKGNLAELHVRFGVTPLRPLYTGKVSTTPFSSTWPTSLANSGSPVFRPAVSSRNASTVAASATATVQNRDPGGLSLLMKLHFLGYRKFIHI